MEGLLLRLSSLDADAENAVRVIGFFDRLIATRASLDTIVSKARALAECPLGVSSSARGLQVGGPIPAHATRRELEDGTVVWLARDGKPLPLDEMVLERFSIAVALSLELSRVPLPALGDPALVELVLSDSAGEAERSRALHLLGLKPTTPLRVLAVRGTPTGLSAALGSLHAVLAPNEIPDQDGEVGISAQVPAINAPAAWAEARTVLRFTSQACPVGHADELGSQIALASLSREHIATLPDVIALDGLDPQLLTVLTALVRTNSNRKAAAAVHRHHSTIPARIAQAEPALGFPIDTPSGRFRLQLALILRHLRDN
ncbi:helix-turn-helix domain-containing protein [Kibdelosporangium philippinense]|uniref:Helix-turn-helix domain-containing protein n=1 Tax=Kibdelosporangium philippinense TaxID=211113 RepID=A0ABS8Z180_9PSEU|nr:helix-turn-helix domain-containing protein [Kibdelosporangium philippinense]MCE7001699.1 helix-turn-helix domain-containing protein [Kibdelosporangium philippinense]